MTQTTDAVGGLFYPITHVLGGALLGEERRDALMRFEDLALDGYAASTRDQLSRVARDFSDFLRRTNYGPFPTVDAAIVDYVRDLARRGRKPASIETTLAYLSTLYRAAVHEADNPVRTKLVRLAVRGVKRQRGIAQKRAAPISADQLERLIAAAGDDLRGKRDRALVAVAWSALLRRSEVAALTLGDVVFEDDGSAAIRVRSSKTDVFGEGAIVPIDERALSALLDYLAAMDCAAEDVGHDSRRPGVPLFRAISKSGRMLERGIASSSVQYIYRRLAEKAGLPSDLVTEITGHSMRRGAASAILDAGVDPVDIRHLGRWASESDMLARYADARVTRRDAQASRRILRAKCAHDLNAI